MLHWCSVSVPNGLGKSGLSPKLRRAPETLEAHVEALGKSFCKQKLRNTNIAFFYKNTTKTKNSFLIQYKDLLHDVHFIHYIFILLLSYIHFHNFHNFTLLTQAVISFTSLICRNNRLVPADSPGQAIQRELRNDATKLEVVMKIYSICPGARHWIQTDAKAPCLSRCSTLLILEYPPFASHLSLE